MPTSSAATEAARRFWSRAMGDTPSGELGAAAAGVQTHLRHELSRWIGAEGVRALSARAILLAQEEHPNLDIDSPDAAAITAAVQAHGRDYVTAGLIAQLAAVIDLLGRIIGEEMGMQLVKQAGTTHSSVPRPEGS